jgi:hypothetical protein
MKKLLSLSALLIFAFGVSQSTTYIPDDIFEQKLIDLGFDDVLDNYVLTANISSIENLNLDNEENYTFPGFDVIYNYIPYEISGAIYDLTGIQDFTSLVSLDVGFNRISSLDLSNNFSLAYLDCEYNDILSELILPSSGPNGSESPLGFIYGRINAISSIDLTNSPNLHTAYFQRNLIPQINVQLNPLLETLIISRNSFTEINVCYNPLLFMFMFDNNNISELDISNNPLITYLYGHNTLLSCVRVSDLDNPYLDDPYIYPYYWFDEGVEFSLDCGFVNQCEPLNLFENEATNFSIYPNPTTQFLNISSLILDAVTIYNIVGKELIKVSNQNRIDVSSLSKGIYIIKVSDGINTSTKKFIKN